jgi:hypothetical protein
MALGALSGAPRRIGHAWANGLAKGLPGAKMARGSTSFYHVLWPCFITAFFFSGRRAVLGEISPFSCLEPLQYIAVMTEPGEVLSANCHRGSFKSGNLQRAKWRSKTRDVLANHLSKSNNDPKIRLTTVAETRLGMSVEPADIRLIPGPGDGYTWAVLPEKQYLFSKQLSKHSIGAYMELCRGVGVSFEALADSEPGKAPQGERAEVRHNLRRRREALCLT